MALIQLLILVMLHGGDWRAGVAPHYAPGLMERVAARRGLAADGCLVSSPRYTIGTVVWVEGIRTGDMERCTVVDVSAPRDRARHLRTGREVELSFASAARICGTTRGRADACPVLVIRLEE